MYETRCQSRFNARYWKLELPYDPAIPLLGIHTEETRRERDTCTPMFIAALFIIARTWKQPRCPSDEWIRKLWYIYTMEYYSAIKLIFLNLFCLRSPFLSTYVLFLFSLLYSPLGTLLWFCFPLCTLVSFVLNW